VKGFVVLPRRWKVERTIGWCMNARRNARDYERLPQHFLLTELTWKFSQFRHGMEDAAASAASGNVCPVAM
jgi:transposase